MTPATIVCWDSGEVRTIPLRCDPAGNFYARIDGFTLFVSVVRSGPAAVSPAKARWSGE